MQELKIAMYKTQVDDAQSTAQVVDVLSDIDTSSLSMSDVDIIYKYAKERLFIIHV